MSLCVSATCAAETFEQDNISVQLTLREMATAERLGYGGEISGRTPGCQDSRATDLIVSHIMVQGMLIELDKGTPLTHIKS